MHFIKLSDTCKTGFIQLCSIRNNAKYRESIILSRTFQKTHYSVFRRQVIAGAGGPTWLLVPPATFSFVQPSGAMEYHVAGSQAATMDKNKCFPSAARILRIIRGCVMNL